VIAGARSARPVQVLGRCATRSTFDQQSDRVGLVLLPGGEAWSAAGKRFDLGAVVRGAKPALWAEGFDQRFLKTLLAKLKFLKLTRLGRLIKSGVGREKRLRLVQGLHLLLQLT